MSIRSIAVLGAGTMGAQIAAHCANAGFPVLLLDVSRPAARDGVERARALKPDPFFLPGTVDLIRTGSFDEDLGDLSGADWIIEAVIEQADVKQALLERVDRTRRPGAIVSSNTSGLSISGLADGRSADFRRHWLGTHFFNPPRYMQLVEIIPTSETDPAVVTLLSGFIDRRLGKSTVLARDTPGFIANHVAMHGLIRIFEVLAAGAFTVEEIDAITGAAIGRPKSATFRTADIAGLDVLARVASDLAARLPAAVSAQFTLPAFVTDMCARGWIGEKAGRGFYERRKTADGETEIWTLDPARMEYRPRRAPALPSLETAASLPLPQRMRALFEGHDRVAEFLRATWPPSLAYAAAVAPEISYAVEDVDRAMRWGYGWPLGPLELTRIINGAKPQPDGDSAGVRHQLDRTDTPPVLASNPGASLIDLGDGVLCVSLHSKMNAIGGDALQMLQRGVREASANFAALVVGSEAANFSVGANLMLLLLEAREGNWDEIDEMIRAFQRSTTGLRYSAVPVVVATRGLALGGGCEIALHADRIEAAAETYMGLVEASVGLIPAAGGSKEMVLRGRNMQKSFETLGFAKVSTCAPDARRLGFLKETDRITMNRENLLKDAKQTALDRVRDGYTAPSRPTAIPVGGDALRATLDLGVHLAWRGGRITDHEALVGRKLSWVLSGGAVPAGTTVSEEYLLDLEREVFLSLCGEPKTLERIQHTLKTGKTLRN
jgi:3-hydroxyacyl-CoA dehydrogenase